MFEEYAAVKPLDPWEIEQYLKRIGYTGSREPVKETLDALIYAHQCSVPFETLDPHDFGITVDLHPDAVFDKIVRKGRGGYCLELNGSFYRLLISLGFEVRPCLCRVLLGTEEWTHPIDHRTNLVTVGGRTYFCDVGVGGPMPPAGLDIAREDWQDLRGELFRVAPDLPGWRAIRRRTRAGGDLYNENCVAERTEMLFTTIHCYETDVQFLNQYMSGNPQALHVQHRILNLRTADGYRAIWDDEYKELRDGQILKTGIGDNLHQILEEKFGIVV